MRTEIEADEFTQNDYNGTLFGETLRQANGYAIALLRLETRDAAYDDDDVTLEDTAERFDRLNS